VNGATHARWSGAVPPGRDELNERFDRAGLNARWWSNGPGETYDAHAHSYDKILYCAAGSITFRLPDGHVRLGPGDRLDIRRGVEHAATVGERGVTCVEAGVEDGPDDQGPRA